MSCTWSALRTGRCGSRLAASSATRQQGPSSGIRSLALMQPTVAVSIGVELAEVEAAVGATSFKRGKTYARARIVCSR